MAPPSGSMRITSAPICAMVMPPSGAATKAENSTMRRSVSSRFIALRSGPENDSVHDAPGQQGEQSGDHQRAEKQSAHRSPVPLDLMAPRQPHSQRAATSGGKTGSPPSPGFAEEAETPG